MTSREKCRVDCVLLEFRFQLTVLPTLSLVKPRFRVLAATDAVMITEGAETCKQKLVASALLQRKKNGVEMDDFGVEFIVGANGK